MTVILRDKGCVYSTIGWWLAIVGALNWGLVGLGYFLSMNLNVVDLLFHDWPVVENLVYVLVGAAGIMLLIGCKCAKCRADTPPA